MSSGGGGGGGGGGGSLVKNIGLGIATGGLYTAGQFAVSKLAPLLAPPTTPQPNAPTGNQTYGAVAGSASTSAVQNQLNKEKNAAVMSPTTTSGAGLLDEPTTTSRVLMGN